MQFMPGLAKFLEVNKKIYTVRMYNMSYALVPVEGLEGLHVREPLGIVGVKEELEPLVVYSGFDSLDAWWAKITEFIPNPKSTKYLYRVSKYTYE